MYYGMNVASLTDCTQFIMESRLCGYEILVTVGSVRFKPNSNRISAIVEYNFRSATCSVACTLD